MEISNIDTNFKVENNLNLTDVVWINVFTKPLQVYGLYNNEFRRMPENIAKSVSEGLFDLHTNTAGGRVRFSTNSPYIAIKAEMPNVCRLAHMPVLGTSGFDLYLDNKETSKYFKSYMPDFHIQNGYESVLNTDSSKINSYTINFPLYNNLTSLFIGFQKGCTIEEGCKYPNKKPIVFYGSSITQGACASRPGNSYVNMISRDLNADVLNLGFSGQCKGEENMANYMATLDMSLFVCDYDHNAQDLEQLKNTHFNLYKIIREKNKDLPYIMITRPNICDGIVDTNKRKEIIFSSYQKAVASGDENVYFIDGQTLFDEKHRDCCTVDGIHPNDLGFSGMANVIGDKIKEIMQL